MTGKMAAKKRRGTDLSRLDSGQHLKKQKKQIRNQETESNNTDDSNQDFQAISLLDSDDDLDNALVDDGSAEASDESDDPLDSRDHATRLASSRKKSQASAKDLENDLSSTDSDVDDASSIASNDQGANKAGSKSKRNDPATFSTSLQKILGTKLSATRRSDPVLARSADAREASRRVVDAALEEKARRQLRLEKRVALEKGRVKDVLIASNASRIGFGNSAENDGEETTAKILETERKLRKVAQRGVVKLFNAVRAAQIKASEAERTAKKEGILGIDKRDAKVAEMSRKGFLDLIASGGGGLKKGGLEEA